MYRVLWLLLIAGLWACNTTLGNECWPNVTGGGVGGGEVFPAGVGATSATGDFDAPPRSPQDAPGDPDPCNAPTSAPARFGACKVTWRGGSGPVCPTKDDCATTWETTQRYTKIEDVQAECDRLNGVTAGSGATNCACTWAQGPIKPAKLFACTVEGTCVISATGKKVGHSWMGNVDESLETTARVLARSSWITEAKTQKGCDANFEVISMSCEKK